MFNEGRTKEQSRCLFLITEDSKNRIDQHIRTNRRFTFDEIYEKFPQISRSVNFNQIDICALKILKISLLIFKYYKTSRNDRISASFTWLVTERLLRPVNLKMVQFVDLRKCYEQTVFTFRIALVLL
jgi:hypothetical protein